MKYIYKDKKYDIITGPKGGTYIIVNNKKIYVKINQKKVIEEKENSRLSNSSSNKRNTQNGRSNLNDGLCKSLTRYVPDPEHEGDINHELRILDSIGKYEIIRIDREYTEDGEELVYAAIHFTCKEEDYPKFKEYCDL